MSKFNSLFVLIGVLALLVVGLILILTAIHVTQQNGDRNSVQNQQYRLACTAQGGVYIEQRYDGPLCIFANKR